MQKILKWFSLLFAVSIAIFVIYFLYDINKDEDITQPEPFVYKSEIQKKKDDGLWLDDLIKKGQKDYFFPVNEIFIKVDLEKIKKKKKVYQLFVNKLDPYEIFCLNQELKRYKIRYFFKKDKNSNKLLVYSNDVNRLNSLVNVLKRYQIKAKIKEVKDEKIYDSGM